MNDYKSEKEAFVTGMTGSSIERVNLISSIALASIALHSTLRTRLPTNRTLHFPAEFCVLGIPLLLSVTVFAESPVILLLILLVPTGVLLFVPARESGTPLPSSHNPSRSSSPSKERSTPNGENSVAKVKFNVVPPLAALTTYRAHMILLTAICILAVDFRIFPRSLAKCETFGVSVMDLGVGSFVFSQGVVSAIPLIKDPAYLKAPILQKLGSVGRRCLPLLMLGLLRMISVKGTEYPEHQTEYGTHWNFFVTMGLIPVLQVLLDPLMIHLPISLLGVILALSHQATLSIGGLMEYVLYAPRVGLVSANKEGIISVTGYLAIHLIGLSTGTLLLPPSPSYFRRLQAQLRSSNPTIGRTITSDPVYDSSDDDTPRHRSARIQHRRENDKTATELFSYAALWWIFLGLILFMQIGGGVSRRMVNLPYIIWVAAFNTTFILGYLLLDLLFFPSPLSKSIYSPTSKLKVQPDHSILPHDKRNSRGPNDIAPPALLEAINRNGLVLFLLANVATGLVNLSIQTMYVPDHWAFLILCVYTFGISLVAWSCRNRRIWKF